MRIISIVPIVGAWRSLVAHLPWAQGVGGSNPLAPTKSIAGSNANNGSERESQTS